MEILCGCLIGFITSMMTWYVLYHWIVPSLEFFPTIDESGTDENPSGHKYRIRFQNNGRREILDLELFAKLKVQGLSTQHPTSWKAIYIPIEDPRIPRVVSQRGTDKRIAVQLLVTEIAGPAFWCMPPKIKAKCQHHEVTLEEIMDLGKNTTLEIMGFGYDAFSSTRKIFVSKMYSKNDISHEP